MTAWYDPKNQVELVVSVGGVNRYYKWAGIPLWDLAPSSLCCRVSSFSKN